MTDSAPSSAAAEMSPVISRAEWWLVAMAVLVAAGLRLQHADLLAIEHFDEGVYSAPLWYQGAEGGNYPSSHLYAPPLLSWCIQISALVTGNAEVAPFLPSMICGVLTVPLLWWMARCWFGQNAGLFLLFVVALNEFHVQLSRFALTDAPSLFLICAAVSLALCGLQKRSFGWMVAAGLVTGLAWWMKYLGWLPLAIVSSGGTFWWLLSGRRSVGIGKLLLLLITMIITATLAISPWLWMLQPLGGYAAVRANHAAYVSYDFAAWKDHLYTHIIYQIRFDSWVGACSITIGILAAANRRWIDLARSTWNETTATNERFPPRRLLLKFVGAAVVLGVISLGITTIGLLVCLAIGGLAGIFIWGTLNSLYRQTLTGDSASDNDLIVPLTEADRRAAPVIDPMLGTCVVTAWLIGLLVTTPLYEPFPRLGLPLLAAVWLAAAGGVAWWIEANLNVARRPAPTGAVPRTQQVFRQMLTGMILGAVALAVLTVDLLDSPSFWQDRRSLRDASLHLAENVLEHAKLERPVNANANQNYPIVVTPDPVGEDGESELSGTDRLLQKIEEPFLKPLPLVDPQPPKAVVYTFGEPAVAAHLHAAGLTVAPVAVIPDQVARLSDQPLRTYFVIGPNALRTDGFLNNWASRQYQFRHIRDFHFAPSDLVLLNLFTPQWIRQHVESRVQKLELYELIAAP